MDEIKIGDWLCHVIGWPRDDVWCWLDFDDVIIDTGRSKVLACRELLGRDIPAHLLDSAKLK